MYRYKGVLKSLKCSECREVNKNPDLIVDYTNKLVYFACKNCSFKNRFQKFEY